ncbi:MAG: aldo/keto reductase [Phycisphaerales bacterium]|nr:aldo/keto reductase [Phycisphaerales bacterium]
MTIDMHQYVTLGRSGLRVSPLCLGAMTFGTDWGFGSDLETSHRVMDTYLDSGGNFIDTANVYTKGHSERILGDHLCKHPAKRDRIVLATKWCGNMFTGDPNAGGASRKNILDSVHHSLRRLQTDYIDLLWMHFWDALTPIDETMRTLDDLVRAGKVRYIGFSDTPAWKCAQAQMLARFHGWSPLVALQIEYNLVERTVEGDLISMARELGMGVTPWSPLKGGVLTGKFTRDNPTGGDSTRGDWATGALNDRVFNIIDALIKVSKEAGCTPAQAALAWLRAKPGVSSVIIGARTSKQLEDNLASAQVDLHANLVQMLDDVSKPSLPFPYQFLERVSLATQGGTTVNGRPSEPWPLAPANDDERW